MCSVTFMELNRRLSFSRVKKKKTERCKRPGGELRVNVRGFKAGGFFLYGVTLSAFFLYGCIELRKMGRGSRREGALLRT